MSYLRKLRRQMQKVELPKPAVKPPLPFLKNRDAFQLMEYTCKDCGHIEDVWNSRNAVSPFAIECSKCDGTMQHTNWQFDRWLPHYVPPSGTRYFVDFTSERAEEAAKGRIAAFAGTEYGLEEGTVEYTEVLQSLIAEFLNERSMDIATAE